MAEDEKTQSELLKIVEDLEKKRASELHDLAGLSDVLNTTRTLQEVLDYTFERARRLIEVDQLVLFLYEPFEGVVKAEMAVGGTEWWKGISIQLGEGRTGRAIEKREVQIVSDLEHDSIKAYIQWDRREKAMVSLPLICEGRALGALNAYKNKVHTWTPDETNLLKIITSTATSALVRNEMQEMIRNRTTKMVYAFSKAVGAKTAWNKEHSARVTGYAVQIARQMGFTDTAIRIVRQSAMIHDVGKLYVGGYILDKPSGLSPEEREVMNKHPEKGVEIIDELDIDHLKPGILYHHERWDGSGYPRGLKGEQIPMIARILAVADSFDAMTSDRPYRKAMSPEQACKELTALAGKLYDPVVVEAFLKTNYMSILHNTNPELSFI